MLQRVQDGDVQLAYRAAGTGETVLLLHGSAGSHLLWRRLGRLLEPRYRVIAPDLLGYGQSSPWPDRVRFGLEDEMAPLWRLLPENGPLHIVGYSYGAVVGLGLALAKRKPVSSLALIEPVAFRVLRDTGHDDLFDEASHFRRRFEAYAESGDLAAAMRAFLDYWSDAAASLALPEEALSGLLSAAPKIPLDMRVAYETSFPVEALAAIATPSLLLSGGRSPRPTQGVALELARLLGRSELVIMKGAGHDLPMTHADALHRMLLRHIAANSPHSSHGPGPPVCSSHKFPRGL
jgi:pimeloyl-ACP methyl ester carboxylesterase